MKKVLGTIIGVSIGCLLGLGEVDAQTDWFEEPGIIELEWEEIVEEEQEETNYTEEEWEIARTHDEDVIKEWWMLDHGDDEEIPNDIEEAGVIYGNLYGICPEFLYAIAAKESWYTNDAKNGSCVGVMQVSQYWHAWRCAEFGLKVSDLYDPYVNMMVGAWYLSDLFEKYDGDPAPVLMEYNGDSAGLSNYWKTGKMSKYAEWILNYSAELERRHGK